MTDSVRIIKCVCHGTTFATLKAIAHEKGVTEMAELHRFGLFGQNCRRCVPYVRRMLSTGEVEFFEILIEEDTAKSTDALETEKRIAPEVDGEEYL